MSCFGRHALMQREGRGVATTEQGAQLPKIYGKSELAKAIRYALTRMKKMRVYLDHGILELDNNSAERSMRGVAVGRKNYLFMGSENGGRSAAIAYTSLRPPSSTQSIRRRGSLMSSPASPTTRSPGSTNSSLGVTLLEQRNRPSWPTARAGSPDAHYKSALDQH